MKYIPRTVRLRTEFKGRKLKDCATQLDGRTFMMRLLWTQGKGDPYPREQAWQFQEDQQEIGWISDGDLLPIEQVPASLSQQNKPS